MPLDERAVLAESQMSPEDEAELAEEKVRLLGAIEKLKPDQQSVIRMRHEEKLTFAEIGERMNRSPDAVRMTWNRAIDELAKILSQQ